MGLTEYFVFYNHERPHQALAYETPDAVYRSGVGGGAKIVDKFIKSEISSLSLVSELISSESGQRCSVADVSIA